MKHKNTLVELSKNAFKASLILFILASGLMIYVAINADPSLNFSDINSGETVYTYPIYREAGEKFQLYVGLMNDGDYYDESSDSYDHYVEVLHIVIYKSSTSKFENAEIINEFTSNGIYRQIESLEDAYYRIGITNISANKVQITSGDAHANVGLLVAVVVAAIMFAISATLFSVAFSLTITGLILFGLGYPIYLFIRQEQERQKSRDRVVYYPKGYTPNQNQQNQV